jgi:glycosyltransferase involved in cell wall biosynthesis
MSSVGIYMPCYNVSPYIGEALASITSQSFTNWELVVIDDCSDDDTFEQAQSNVKDRETRVKLFKREEHSGRIGQVKNEAIAKLSKNHEYICHVGSDDIIPQNCLEIFVTYMDKHPEIGACCGNFICFNDEGKQWSFPHVSNSGDYDPDTLLRYMCLFPHRFYRWSVVNAVGGYSNELSSSVDYDLALKIDEITKIHRIKDPITYYYRQHSQQVSTKFRGEQDLNAKKALENALKRRNINAIVKNNAPPFILEIEEEEKHFIWGK